MNLALWLARSAQRFGDRTAIDHGKAPWCSYRELAHRAGALAAWLHAQGLQPGDRVGLFMSNRPEYLVWLWGLWWAGVAAVPVNAKLHSREAAWILAHSGARLAVCDATAHGELATLWPLPQPGAQPESQPNGRPLAEPLRTALPPLDGTAVLPEPVERSDSDPVWLFYTSGTTGRPKGVVLAARQLREASLGYLSEVQAVAPGDAMLHPAPLSHGSGLYHLPYVMHGGVNVVPASGGFDPAEIVELAAHRRNASFFAAPTMVRRLVDHVQASGRRPEGLATITYGGGPMYLADIRQALQVIGPHFAQIYGQGESPMTITVLPRRVINDDAHPRHLQRLASVGYAQPMLELSIRSADGAPLPAGETGEVCVRGDVVMQGYWQQPEATAAAIRDGWLYTGDVGRLDDEGFLTLLDRSKDLIISGGSNIYPREVEEVLLQHPAVHEASVIGARDAEWGEVVVAYVVARSAIDGAALDAFCREHIARFKRPKVYRFVDALPKNHYGKVLKTELREREAGGDGGC
ncbi:MAG: AMP-binding protein [Ideonella sp.]|nr:AMP-binding protein [Ideonella sp.]MCC7456693.1 AMP-binding protein [Nitrospira sp.]